MSQKRRRSVRCTMCTPHRWKGNAQGRFKLKDEQKSKNMKEDIKNVNKENQND